ncbi:MAG: GIY-YIG nuclease family protein [Ignavibacteria bacterium]
MKGIYLLEIKAASPFRLLNKVFYDRQLPEGYYYYSGSAQKNLESRIARHAGHDKVLHWHIDYITSLTSNKVEKIYIFPEAGKDIECELTRLLSAVPSCSFPVKGFGNSDCSKCHSHLIYSPTKQQLKEITDTFAEYFVKEY